MNKKNIEKYLKNYAESDHRLADELIRSRGELAFWDRVLAVPLCAESENILILLQSIARSVDHRSIKPILIFVVNNRESGSDQVKEDNEATWGLFLKVLSDSAVIEVESHRMLAGKYESCDVAVIDRFSKGREIPEKQGVGLARKIGSDFATNLCLKGLVSTPVIFNTDGDAEIGLDYFNLDEFKIDAKTTDTYLTPFVHQVDPSAAKSEQMAIRLYDRYLYYYVEGLSSAGSPYAYQTVGSTISYHVNAYAAVRGFPRREAGEDFYLLNKLAKVGSIRSRNVEPTLLQGRVSFRVPFGTGASVGRISGMLDEGSAYQVYDEKCFDFLGVWLKSADLYMAGMSLEDLKIWLKSQAIEIDVDSSETVLLNYLETSGSFNALVKARDQFSKLQQQMKSFHDWFDSFRTLKFIHEIRDQLLPSKPLVLDQ